MLSLVISVGTLTVCERD